MYAPVCVHLCIGEEGGDMLMYPQSAPFPTCIPATMS